MNIQLDKDEAQLLVKVLEIFLDDDFDYYEDCDCKCCQNNDYDCECKTINIDVVRKNTIYEVTQIKKLLDMIKDNIG